MEYVIDQLHPDNYTITPDYNNGKYRIAYAIRNPDDFDRVAGIVENEPYKIKVSINNVDSETKKVIQNNTVYTIYEWNKESRTIPRIHKQNQWKTSYNDKKKR